MLDVLNYLNHWLDLCLMQNQWILSELKVNRSYLILIN